MINEEYIKTCDKYYLKTGYVYVTKEPCVITTVLGSCISVCLYDKEAKYGGINHYILPIKGSGDEPSTRFGDVSMNSLYKTFIEFGSKKNNLYAKIVGGAHIDGNKESEFISNHNIQICKRKLNDFGIKILFNETGGIHGRKIIYYSEYNEIKIETLNIIKSDEFIKKYDDYRQSVNDAYFYIKKAWLERIGNEKD